jgi:hypothetical protein
MTRIKMMAAKIVKPAIAQRAVLKESSSPGVCVPIFGARGCVGVSMFLYMTRKRNKGNTNRTEIPHSFVRDILGCSSINVTNN